MKPLPPCCHFPPQIGTGKGNEVRISVLTAGRCTPTQQHSVPVHSTPPHSSPVHGTPVHGMPAPSLHLRSVATTQSMKMSNTSGHPPCTTLWHANMLMRHATLLPGLHLMCAYDMCADTHIHCVCIHSPGPPILNPPPPTIAH